jgi:hypothetical protein
VWECVSDTHTNRTEPYTAQRQHVGTRRTAHGGGTRLTADKRLTQDA